MVTITRLGPELKSVTTISTPYSVTTIGPTATGVYSFREYITKSDTVRRVKPSDLRIAGTALSRFHSVRSISNSSVVSSAGLTFTSSSVPVTNYISTGARPSSLIVPESDVSGLLRKKIKDQNLNLAQNLGEYRQTAKLFGSLTRDIFRTLRSIRSSASLEHIVRWLQKPQSRKQHDIANRWLEYQYGLRPAVNDIYAASEALAQKLRTGYYIQVRARSTQSRGGNDVCPSPLSRYWEQESCMYGRAVYMISDPTLKSLSEIGISNPLLAFWELIPHSFVVDWLFPVGDWLSSLDALNGTSGLQTQYTHIQKEYQLATAYGGKDEFRSKTYSRGSMSNLLPLPRLSYRPSTSLKTVLNGLALLTQTRLSSRRK